MKPGYVLNTYRDVLTEFEKSEILDYRQIYFVGPNAQKVHDSHLKEYNNGYDDERGDYKVVIGDHIGYRFEVKEKLGKGSFGQAYKCWDHKEKEYVALKIIRNKKKLQYQANIEVKILTHLRDHDPDDTHNVIRMKDAILFRNHLWVGFELLNINLYEFIKLTDFEGLSVGLIRRFAIQILYALNFFKQQKIIHWDLKPENILLKNKYKSGIKVIDLGSACFIDSKVYTYIQSRFYRAPEIILGVPYTYAIDMWSLGCILAELYTGLPLFQGESEKDQIGYIMEILDVPPPTLLMQGARSHLFFERDGTPIITPNSRGKRRYPCTKDIQQVMECDDRLFLDFIMRCLVWEPEKRMTPEEALRHEWVLDGLPPQILINHQKLHNIPDNALPINIKKKLDKFFRKKTKEDKKSTNKSLSSKSNSTDKNYSLSKKSSTNNSIPRKKKTRKFELIGFSPKSNWELTKEKLNKEARKSISKGKKKLKITKKRKHRFIRRLGDRKGQLNGTATNQTATIEESSEERSAVQETSLPNKKSSNDMGVYPNNLPFYGKKNRLPLFHN